MLNPIPQCDYILHDDGVHEFIFIEAGREAVDWHIKKLIELREALPEGAPLCYMVNASKGKLPPLRYTFDRTRQELRKTNFLKDAYAAGITKDNAMFSMVSAIGLSIMPQSSLKMFTAEKYDEARAWLREKLDETEEAL